jgi:Alkylmercury lyase
VDTEDVRLAVYRSFTATGRAPEPGPLPEAALRELHEQRHVVLDRDGRIVMAHPFAAVPLGFSVMDRETLWWGGCAWDSFALPHLLCDDPEVLVATRCPGCGAALAWVVDRVAPPAGEEVAHFLIPAARMWDDVVHTCGHQRLFCGEECVAAWLDRTGDERGYVMDLGTLWRLAQGWYAGRLDRGYQRREPSEAKEYFRSVGLRGPFWGL